MSVWGINLFIITIHAGVNRVFISICTSVHCICVCVSACLSVRAVKRKRLELSTGNSIEPKFHGRSSACIDPEVKRSRLRSGLRFQFWLGLGWVKAGMDLHVDTTAHFLVLFVSLSFFRAVD